MKQFLRSLLIGMLIVSVIVSVAVPMANAAEDKIALRRKCAHLLKVRLGVKETGSVDDLRGVRGAVAMVDRCVANKGKLD